MGYILVMLLVLIIGILFIMIESAIERRTIELCHYHVQSNKLKKDTQLTFIVLADLHSKDYGNNNSALIHGVKGENPDAILIPGDMIVGRRSEDFTVAIDLLKELVKIAPVYYSHGNHEERMQSYRYNEATGEYVTDLSGSDFVSKYDHYRALVDATGTVILDNETTTFEVEGGRIHIAGLSISMDYFEKFNHELMKKEEVTLLLERDILDAENRSDLGSSIDGTPFEILLAHNPVHMDAYTKWGADLTVSGHLHGGIIRIPFVGGIITPQVKFLPKYSAGLYKANGKSAVVSRGLGEHTVNVRVCNPPELSVIHITR